MGYRNMVAIKCEENSYDLFKEVFEKEEMYVMPDNIYKEDDNYILYWDWVKWDSCYNKGVKAIEEVMERLDELGNEDFGYGYKFIRLGEDFSDIEERNNDSDIELWTIHKIDIPEGLEEIKVESVKK